MSSMFYIFGLRARNVKYVLHFQKRRSPRMVITLDRFSEGITEQGIRIVNAIDWLLGE